MTEHTHCNNPDRHNPKLVCGYLLPCLWHTATLHMYKEPVTVEIPLTAKRALRERAFLADIASIVKERKR